jgi:hypothetical protein
MRGDAPQAQQRLAYLCSRDHADQLGVPQQRLGRRKVEFPQPIEPGDTSIQRPICGRAESSKQARTGVVRPQSGQIDQDPGRGPRAEKSRDDIADRS